MGKHHLEIDESIKRLLPGCRLGYILFDEIAPRGTSPALIQEFLKLEQEVATAYQLDNLPKLPRIIAVRSMYKKFSVDPSRYRPASEALVRRVLQNKKVYYVNSAVDVNNFCSIKYLLPFGLYDFEKVQGNIVYRLAGEGSYINIAGIPTSTEKKPFLCDELGVFGNPTSDSQRTAVTLSTKQLMCVVYADEEVSDVVLNGILDFSAEMMIRYNGGKVREKSVVIA